MTWKLQTVTGEFTGKEVSIERDMLVGRHQDADLLIQSADISRRHAAFLLKEDALWIQDLKSSNGTFVNDVRIENEALLKEGDIVQFASHKFSVLQPVVVKADVVEVITPVIAEDIVVKEVAPVVESIQQPSEAIATSETAQAEPAVEKVEKTASQAMAEQGMPDLKERDANVQLSRDGMPQNVSIPKPAPIPEGVDIHAVPAVEKKSTSLDEVPAHCSVREEETQKNASIGLIALFVIIAVAFAAWFIFN